MSRSIYLGADASLTIRDVNEKYEPQGSQALISVKYSGINHCDLNFAHVGLHSYVTGFEFSGVVEATGPDSSFKVGDSVFGVSTVPFPKPSSLGTHQDKAIVENSFTYKVPEGLDLKDAGGCLMGAQTAADAIFNILGSGWPAAGVQGISPAGRPILIWGGATNVGVSAIQLSKQLGFSPILVTASPKNHAKLQDLGATHCFDYRSPSVVDDIRATVKKLGVTLTTAFDTACSGVMSPDVEADKTSPALTRKCLSDGANVEAIKLASTLPVKHDPDFRLCTTYRPPGSIGAMGEPQDPEFPTRTRKVMEYVVETADRIPRHPNVIFVKGAEKGIEEIQRVSHGAASLDKVVIEHPM
ncbi:Trans-enoyl reductase fsdC [Colletotrichum siamense]|nr:Trans-enoyl reductase fsdC [Colletotrichum siamense]